MSNATISSPYRGVDMEFLELVMNLLEEEGYQIESTDSGEEIIAIRIQKNSQTTLCRVKRHDDAATIAVKLIHTIRWWEIELSNHCATLSLQYKETGHFKEECHDQLQFCKELGKTYKKMNVLYYQWLVKTKRLTERKNVSL